MKSEGEISSEKVYLFEKLRRSASYGISGRYQFMGYGINGDEKMYFSSMTFLWLFLPITILLYFIMQHFEKVFPWGGNVVLLAASLIFYAWGEPVYILLLLFSVVMNYLFGRLLDWEGIGRKKGILLGVVLLNIGLLEFFKYSNFLAESINHLIGKEFFPYSPYKLPHCL